MLFFTSLWMTQICCMCFYISQTKEKGFLSLSTYLPKVYIHLQEPKTLSIFTNFPRDFYIVSPRKIEGTLGELCFPRSIFENHYLSLGILAVCSRTKVPCKQSRIISLEKLETARNILSCGHMNAAADNRAKSLNSLSPCLALPSIFSPALIHFLPGMSLHHGHTKSYFLRPIKNVIITLRELKHF